MTLIQATFSVCGTTVVQTDQIQFVERDQHKRPSTVASTLHARSRAATLLSRFHSKGNLAFSFFPELETRIYEYEQEPKEEILERRESPSRFFAHLRRNSATFSSCRNKN